MECDRARLLMSDALDAGLSPELRGHLDACPRCDGEWSEIQAVDVLLRSQPLVDPPAHFGARVMHRVALAERTRPDVRASLGQIAVVVAGVLVLVAGSAVLAHGWRLAVVGSPLVDDAGLVLRALGMFVAAMWAGLARATLTWLVYATVAVVLAVGWFGALVVPRWALRKAPWSPDAAGDVAGPYREVAP